MQSNDDLQSLLDYAYFFLKFRPRSKKELEIYLYKKIQKRHWSQDDVKKVIQHLEELDLVSDKNFVKWFVEQRMLLKPKSEFALKQELLKHGISKEIIDEYFSSHSINEEELAEKTLRERWYRYKYLDKRKRFEKAASFLQRRGFSFDTITNVIKKLQEG
jgi:regulatory protein